MRGFLRSPPGGFLGFALMVGLVEGYSSVIEYADVPKRSTQEADALLKLSYFENRVSTTDVSLRPCGTT